MEPTNVYKNYMWTVKIHPVSWIQGSMRLQFAIQICWMKLEPKLHCNRVVSFATPITSETQEFWSFYSHCACVSTQSAILLPFLAVRPSVCHIEVSYLNECIYRQTFRPSASPYSFSEPQIIIIISGLHHYEYVAPLVANSLQSGQFWARSTASVHDSPWESRSFCIVCIQVIRGRPGGLFQYAETEEVKICLASILSSILDRDMPE